MRKFLAICLAAMALTMGSATSAMADFEAGVKAYDEGDYETALREFKALAEQGDTVAQFNLGLMYSNAQGVVQDYKEAVKWYRKAADQGDADAQGNLGYMYDHGLGVLHDKVLAHMWGNIAGANGNKLGAENRAKIEKKMTQAQIARAQELAREWMEKHQ